MTLVRNRFAGTMPRQTNTLLPYTQPNQPLSPNHYNYGYTGFYTDNERNVGATGGERHPEPIYSTGVQQSTRLNYLPPNQVCAPFQSHEDCNKSPNSKGGETLDWSYGWDSCCAGFCPSKRQCARPDPRECNIGNDILNRDPVLKIEWDGNAPNYRCVYDLHKINTYEQINQFVSKNGKTKSYDQMMAAFCEIPSHVCPIDPDGAYDGSGKNQPMQNCSRLLSLDDEGTKCRAWAATQSKEVTDNVKLEYCLNNPDNPDCRCINRSTSELYIEAKKGHAIPDKCWYKPCSTSVYLQTSDIIENGKNCPKGICQTIYNINKANDVVIKNNTDSIMCDFSQFEPTGPTPTPTPTPIPTPPLPPPVIPPVSGEPVYDGLLQNKTVLIAGAAMAAFAVIFLLFILMRKSE
jgi:hypothetical protein